MHKRSVLPGAFALPGLADDSKKSTSRDRISRKRRDIDQYSVETETPRISKSCAKGAKTNNTNDDSLSLVDRRGEFLPQSSRGRLEHLTKSRPRSPARRPNTRRSRSRSPELSRDSFEFALGLNNNTNPENTDSKQSTGETKKKYSSPLNSNVVGKSDVTKQGKAKDLKLSKNTMTNNEENNALSAISSGFDSYSEGRESTNYNGKDEDSELSQQESDSDSDEDLGDMLIGDYVDSDESVRDDLSPPLPSSPPPLDEEITFQNVTDDSISENTLSKRESYSRSHNVKTTAPYSISSDTNKGTLNIQRNYTSDCTNNYNTNDLKLSKEPAVNDSSVMSKNKTFSLPGHGSSRHPMPTQTISQSSSRRRRFKPVSLDDVIASSASDALSKTGTFETENNDNVKINRTFPGSSSERLSFESGSSDSSGYKREIDWGLRPGPLDTNLKSGTIFDQFLKGKQSGSEQQNKIGVDFVKRNLVTAKVAMDKEEDTNSNVLTSKKENAFVNINYRNGKPDTDFEENSLHNEARNNTFDVNTGQQMRSKATVNLDDYSPNDSREADNDDDDDNEHVNIYNSHSYDTSNIDYEGDGDGVGYNNYIDKYDTQSPNDNNDEHVDIKVTMQHEIENPTDSHYHNNEIIDDNKSTHDGESVSIASTDNEDMDMKYTFDHITERTHFNGVFSPGEVRLDESHDNNSLNMSQGLYTLPKWDENGDDKEYSAEALSDGNKEFTSDDDEGRDESIGSNELSEDIDYLCQDYEHYAQVTDNTQSRDPTNYLNQEIHEDNVIEPPHLFNEEHETSLDEAEDLFEPPPMFASDEDNDELDFDDIPPPLITSPVMPTKKVMPFHKIPLVDWTEEDALQWLRYVGLGHFREQFQAHHVDGRTLKNIDFQFLEEIGISAPDERELVLSEIYDLDNPSEEEHFEAEIQDALETATEQDKEKILAVLTALRSPTLNNSMDFPSPQESCSPMDSDPGYHMSSDTTSLASSVTASDEHSHKGSTGVTPSQSQHVDLHSAASGFEQAAIEDTKNKDETKAEGAKETAEHKKSKDKKKKKSKTNKKNKKSITKFWESLSISHKSSKLTKLFGSKKLNPAMQYLLQSGPQGIVRVYPTSLSGQTKYCSFMVSMTTTSAQVLCMVLDKYDMVADPLRYYLCEIGLGRGGANQVLEEGDCPLTWQCRWNDPEKYKFEMRCRDEGSVRMLFEMEEYEGDLDYRSIAVSSSTPCKDVMPLIIKKYDLPGNVEEYQLMEVSEDNEDDRRVVTDHVCPLRLQKAWNEPDHVFRLVRKHLTPASTQPHLVSSEEIHEEIQEHTNLLPRTNSNASSLREEDYETDSTDHHDNVSEDALPEVSKELEEVVMEVQDKIAGQLAPRGNDVSRSRGQSTSADAQLEELRRKDTELQIKEKEIGELKKERDELLAKESELLVWRMRNNELVEREEDLDRLQDSFVEKESQELLDKEKELNDSRSQCAQLLERQKELEEFGKSHRKVLDELENEKDDKYEELRLRDQEIERLYSRNNEFVVKEKELEERMKIFIKLKTELENKHVSSSSSSSKQRELETTLQDLLQTNESLQNQLDEARNMRKADDKNTEEMMQLQLRLETAESENNELHQKVEDIQRRNVLLERSANLLDSMRQENRALAGKTKEMDEMKRNLIRLTSQLREADNLRLNQGDFDDMKLRISICEAEKQQLQLRVEEGLRRNCGLREGLQETDRLRKENRTLKEQVDEMEEVRSNVESLRKEIEEGEVLRENLSKVQVIEKSLTKEIKSKDILLKQQDERIDKQEKKIKVMTDAMKKMERKSEEQNQQRETLTRLLNVIKDRDPSLLKSLHKSLSTSESPQPQQPEEEEEEEEEEDEEWC